MSTHRKQILTLGPLKLPITEREIDITTDFVATLQRNLAIVDYVPMVVNNTHIEDPQKHVGEVRGLVIEGDKVLAVFVLDIELDLKLYDAFAMMHLNYTDTRTGEKVGPALLHVLLKPHPMVPGS